jgi:DNA anti-recombination protein RmuC
MMMEKAMLMIAILLVLAATPGRAYAAGEAKSATAPEATQQKEQYEKGMEERLKKFGRQLDELNARAADMTAQAKRDINRRIAEARMKQKAASEKLEEMRKQSEKKWEKFTSETDAAMDEFEKAYERAKAHFQ